VESEGLVASQPAEGSLVAVSSLATVAHLTVETADSVAVDSEGNLMASKTQKALRALKTQKARRIRMAL
jgi:hypothetical protein